MSFSEHIFKSSKSMQGEDYEEYVYLLLKHISIGLR